MSQRLIPAIQRISLELSNKRDIPSRLVDILQQHLIIICASYPRQPRSDSLRARRVVRSYYKRKRAQTVYVDILDNAPHLFLPFILTVTPKACETLNAKDFFQLQNCSGPIELGRSAKQIFQDFNKKHGLDQSPHYKKLVRVLFPEYARPVTTAESSGYEYRVADLQNVRMVFGERIFDFLCTTPMRSEASRHETECVGTCVPRNNFQDAIIYLRIRQSHELAKTIFPASRQQGTTGTASGLSIPVRLDRASTSALASLFPFRLYNAIEKSQLRSWEKDHLGEDVTNCVTLELDPIEPERGILKLRTDFTLGIAIVKDLYAVHQPTLDVPLYM